MPALKNARHERFVQELAKGKSQMEAYRLAGYSAETAESNAHRLMGNEGVRARLAELQERSAKRVEVTVEKLIEEADEIRLAAMAAGQYSAALGAVKEKGVLSGKRVEKREATVNHVDQMSYDELREYVAREAEELLQGARTPEADGFGAEVRGKPH